MEKEILPISSFKDNYLDNYNNYNSFNKNENNNNNSISNSITLKYNRLEN
jgi:hypothetical protein